MLQYYITMDNSSNRSSVENNNHRFNTLSLIPKEQIMSLSIDNRIEVLLKMVSILEPELKECRELLRSSIEERNRLTSDSQQMITSLVNNFFQFGDIVRDITTLDKIRNEREQRLKAELQIMTKENEKLTVEVAQLKNQLENTSVSSQPTVKMIQAAPQSLSKYVRRERLHTTASQHVLVMSLLNQGFICIDSSKVSVVNAKSSLNEYCQATRKELPKLVRHTYNLPDGGNTVVVQGEMLDNPKLFTIVPNGAIGENAICAIYLELLPHVTAQSFEKEDHYTAHRRKDQARHLNNYQREFDRVNNESKHQCAHTLSQEAHAFQTYMSDHGYIPHLMRKVPQELINRALQYYVSGLGLLHLGKIMRLNFQHNKLFGIDLTPDKLEPPNVSPQPGQKQRKLILKVWRDFIAKEHGVSLKPTSFITGQGSETDEEFEKRIQNMDFTSKAAARISRDAILANKATVQDMARTFVGTVTESLRNQFGEVMSSVSSSIESHFGLSPKAVKIGMIVVIVCCVMLTVFSVSTFLMIARSFFAVKGLVEERVIVGQGHEEDEAEVKKFMAEVISGAVSKATGTDMNGFVSSVNATSRFLSSLRTIADFIRVCMSYLGKALDYVWEKTTGVPFFSATDQARKILAAYENFYSRCMTLDLNEMSHNRKKAKDFCQAYLALQREYMDVHKSTVDQSVATRMQSILLHGYRLMTDVAARLGNCHGRQQPVWTAMFGPPGQGKSVLTKGLVSALAHKLGRDIENHHFFYRNPHDEFWSNYTENHFVAVIDDLFQDKSPEIRARVANELMMMRNICAFPLNMASLAEKGTTMFVTPVIMTSSNEDMTNLKNIGLTSVPALERRMDFTVFVKLKDGVVKEPIIDLTPDNCDNYHLIITHEEGVPVPNPNATAQFAPNRAIPGRAVTFEELVNKIHASYMKALAQHSRTFRKIDWSSKFGPRPPNNPSGGGPPPPPPPRGGGNNNLPPNSDTQGERIRRDSNSSMIHARDDQYNEFNPFRETVSDTIQKSTVREDLINFFSPIKNYFGQDTSQSRQNEIREREGNSFHNKIDQATRDVAAMEKVDESETVTTLSSVTTCSTTDACTITQTMPVGNVTGQGAWSRVKTTLTTIKDKANLIATYFGKGCSRIALEAKTCKNHAECLKRKTPHMQQMWKFFHEYWCAINDVQEDIPYCQHTVAKNYVEHEIPRLTAWVKYFYRNSDNNKDLTIYYFGQEVIDRDRTWCYGTSPHDLTIAKRPKVHPRTLDNIKLQFTTLDKTNWSTITFGIAPLSMKKEDKETLGKALFGDPKLLKNSEEWKEYFQSEDPYVVAQHMNRLYPDPHDDDVRIRAEMLSGAYMNELIELKAALDQRNIGYKALLAYGVFITLVTALGAIIKSVGFNTNAFFTGQSEDKNHTKQMQKLMKTKYKHPIVKTVNQKGVVVTGQTDDNADSVANRVFEKNLIYAHLVNDLDESLDYYSWVFMLGGTVGVTACHSYDIHKPTSLEVYYDPLRDACVTWRIKEVKRVPERDIVFLKFSASTCFKDMTKHLPSKYYTDPIRGIARLSIENHTWVRTEAPVAYPLTEIKYDQVSHVKQVYSAEITNAKGDCGKPYLIYNGKYEKKILGIHVAGDNNMFAVIAPLYAEDVAEFGIGSGQQIVESDKLTGQCFDLKTHRVEGTAHENSNLIYITTYEKKPPQPFVSQIIPTPIKTGIVGVIDGKTVNCAPPFPVTQAPAMLKKTVTSTGIKDPNILAYRHLNNHQILKPPPELDLQEVYDGCFSPVLYRHAKRRLTIEEAVFGCPSMGIDSIDLSTSPGFPWVLLGLKRRDLIDVDKKWIDPRLRREVQFIQDSARQGIVVPHVTVHCLKDETRPLDKVADGFTRAFQIGSLQHLIYHRMTVGFYVFQTEHDKDTDIAVGINVYSMDWDKLYYRLLQANENWIESDCRAWDLTFPPYFAWYFAKVVAERYQIEDVEWKLEILATFVQTLCGYVLLPDGMLVILDRMKSGTFLTSFLNSAFNSVKTRCIYARLANANNCFLPFKQTVEMTKFGDDDLTSAVKHIMPWFNGKTVAQQAKLMFNQTHTSASKDTDIVMSSHNSVSQYLSRTFVPMNNFIVAKLSRESIHSMVQFVRKAEVPMAVQMRINMENALRELVYYGKEEYEQYQRTFNHFLRLCHQPPILVTFEQNEKLMFCFKQ